jgi:hypothetical protein
MNKFLDYDYSIIIKNIEYKNDTLFKFKEYYSLIDIFKLYAKKDKDYIYYIDRNDLWTIIKESFPNCILNLFKNDCMLKNEIFNIFSYHYKHKMIFKEFIKLISLFEKLTLRPISISDFLYTLFEKNIFIFNDLDKSTFLCDNFTLQHFIDHLEDNLKDLKKIEKLIEYFFKLS